MNTTKMTSNITNSIQTIILAIITIVGFYLVFKQIKNLETKFQKNKKENDEIITNIFNLINTQNLNVCTSFNNLPDIKNNVTEKQEPIKEWNNEQFMMEDFPFLVPDRAHMNKLADMRKSLLNNKKSSNSPIHILTDQENIQLSFD